MPRYKQMPTHPNQVLLFSQSVDEALPADSDVRGFADVMDCLEYWALESRCSERGCPPYPPRVMAKILGYAYSKGNRSSRRIEELLRVDVRFMWLAGGLKPDHNTIARFRKENWHELELLFKDSVRVCAQAGLVYLNVVATDGTKISAASSKRRVYSQSKLRKALAGVERILQEAEEADRSEDEMYGNGTGSELPEHLRDAQARKERLEEIAGRLRDSGRKTIVETEADARVVVTDRGNRPGYNLQACVDSESQIIVAMKLTQSENDVGKLPEMVEEVESNTGVSPDVSLADNGYANEETLKWIDQTKHDVLMPLNSHPQESSPNDLFSSRCFLADEEQDVLICPAGRKLVFRGIYRTGSGYYRLYATRGCKSCSFQKKCVGKGKSSRRISISVVADQREAMKARLASPEGRQLYWLRQQTVEPVFGQMKSNQGFERFLCWGLEGARAESALACLSHNVMKCAASAFARAHIAAVLVALFALGIRRCTIDCLRAKHLRLGHSTESTPVQAT